MNSDKTWLITDRRETVLALTEQFVSEQCSKVSKIRKRCLENRGYTSHLNGIQKHHVY